MANNLFPLRIGELVRVWFLARESGTPGRCGARHRGGRARARRVCALIAIALAVLPLLGSEAGVWQRGLIWLAPILLAPVLALAALRAAPGPRARARGVAASAGSGADRGCGAGRSCAASRTGSRRCAAARTWFWLAFHSLLIWLVASTLPFLAAILGARPRPGRLRAHARRGLAHARRGRRRGRAAGGAGLLRPLPLRVSPRARAVRVPAETAVAIGTLCHAVFWISLTGFGLPALRGRRLGDLRSAVPEAGEPR